MLKQCSPIGMKVSFMMIITFICGSTFSATNYLKAKQACISYLTKDFVPGPTESDIKQAIAFCTDSMDVDLTEHEDAIERIRKNPAQYGCKSGAYWVVKGNNKDITDKKMIDQIVSKKCN